MHFLKIFILMFYLTTPRSTQLNYNLFSWYNLIRFYFILFHHVVACLSFLKCKYLYCKFTWNSADVAICTFIRTHSRMKKKSIFLLQLIKSVPIETPWPFLQAPWLPLVLFIDLSLLLLRYLYKGATTNFLVSGEVRLTGLAIILSS